MCNLSSVGPNRLAKTGSLVFENRNGVVGRSDDILPLHNQTLSPDVPFHCVHCALVSLLFLFHSNKYIIFIDVHNIH